MVVAGLNERLPCCSASFPGYMRVLCMLASTRPMVYHKDTALDLTKMNPRYPIDYGVGPPTSFVTCNRGRPLPSLPPLVRALHSSTSRDASYRYHSTFGSLIDTPNSHPTVAHRLYAERKRRDPYLPPDPTDPPDNPLFEIVASISSLTSTQIGGISLGYPLFLASTILILPSTTSILLCAFFVAYWYLGRSVVGGFDDGGAYGDDDEGEDVGDDNGTSDLLALVGAIASAGLLSPDGLTISTDTDGGMPGMGIGLLALGSIAIIASVISQSETQKLAAAKNEDELEEANRRLMDEFDRKLKGPK